jgi:hypothetical protein
MVAGASGRSMKLKWVERRRRGEEEEEEEEQWR